jgi:predicted RNA-binding Zn-ribbon protein involved in translation (DUF1610 family)
MDKYAVVTDDEQVKTAMKGAQPCPSCGSRSVDYRSITPHCPNCGTEPWESHAPKEKGNRRR